MHVSSFQHSVSDNKANYIPFPRNTLDQSQAVIELGSTDDSKAYPGLQMHLFEQLGNEESHPSQAETSTAENKLSTSSEHSTRKVCKFHYRNVVTSDIVIIK